MVAVIAAKTRMHSKPSRKTSTLMSSVAALKPMCGARGSGFPAWLNACQIMRARTDRAATDRAAREAIRETEFELPLLICRGFWVTLLTPAYYILRCKSVSIKRSGEPSGKVRSSLLFYWS